MTDVYLALGQHTTTYFMTDTLAGVHNQTVYEASNLRGWTLAVQSYTVAAAAPNKLIFSTPQRKLIAGSTSTYVVGVSSAYFRVQTRDRFDNIAPVLSNTFIDIFSNSSLGQASVQSDTNTFASIYGSNALTLTFNTGVHQREFFYRDQITGFPSLTAVDQGLSLLGSSQTVVVTPNRADHVTLHHSYFTTSPLSVRTEGTINVNIRDLYNNMADGGASLGENNGLAYTGSLKLATSGSTATVTISGDGVGISTLTLTNAATGSFTVRDLVQETLRLSATDYLVTTINGQTSLSPSDGDVVTTGMVGVDADMAPEPAGPLRSNFKDSIGVANALAQGDGSTLDKPDPVAMMRIRVEVKPAAVPSYTIWNGLRVRKLGTAANSDIKEVAIWKDMGFKDGVFDPIADGDGVTNGVPLATGTFVNIAGTDVCDLNFTASTQTITTVYQQYFLTVRISTSAGSGTTLGFSVDDSGAFSIASALSTARIAENNFPMDTYMSDIIKTPAPVMLRATDVAAYYDNAQSATAPQGNQSVAFLKLGFWTREFQGILDKIKVTRLGTSGDADVNNVRLYMDGLDGTDGDGLFAAGADTLINSTVVTFSTSSATLDLQPNPTINGTTKYFFVVMSIADSALIGSTLGIRIPSRTDVTLTDGVMVDVADDPTTQSFPVLSGTPQIVPTTDNLIISPVPVAPAAATQGDKNVPILRLDLSASDHTVIWQGLRLDRKNANLVNRAQDVADIHVYYDQDGDQVLDTAVDPIVTTQVEPTLFRSSTLRSAISDVTTNIPVQSVDKFAPAPGKLILEDNSGNREVVTYTGIDAVFNEFTGCVRGVDGSTAVAHAMNIQVDGQAYLNILGDLNGQEITKTLTYKAETVLTASLGTSTGPLTITVGDTTEFPSAGSLQIGSETSITYTGKTATTFTGVTRSGAIAHAAGENVLSPGRNKSYFVTFDIDSLAVPGRLAGDQTVLGLATPTTTYFDVQSPDRVSSIGSYNAEIGDILEYGDKIAVVATETVTGNTLQQGALNQPVLMMTLNVNQSDAYWSGVKIYSTGTASPADIRLVKLWRDADNNGVFSSLVDVQVGTGTFGNTGTPTAAQINFSTSTQKLVTTATSLAQNISSRFFVTYDIQTLATPETTIGAGVTVPGDFSMTPTPPNFDTASSTGLPYYSQLRTLIPSPRVVTVVPTVLQSNSIGISSAAMVDVTVGAADTTILVRPDTLSLPTSGYVVIDSEAMFYSNKSGGSLQSVLRGQNGTAAAAHSAGAPIGVYYTQGDLNTAFFKLLMSCNGFNVRWFQLKLNRYLPAGSINGSDADITRIRVWRDNGNGSLDRDPLTGNIPPGTEILIGEKALGTGGDPGGTALIDLNDSSIGSPGFASITATQTTYWVTLDIDPTATYDNLIGMRVQSQASFVVGALTPNDGIHTVSTSYLPFQSPAHLIRPTIDTMQIFVEDLAPPSVTQNQKDVPMARVNLKTNANTAVWRRMQVDLTSANGAVSGDVALVKMFRDVGNDGIFNVQETSKDVNGAYVNMLSQGTEVFTDGSVQLVLDPQVIASEAVVPGGQNFFLAYDINPFAQVAKNLGASIGATSYFTIDAPDLVAFSNMTPPFNSGQSSIQQANNVVTLAVEDVAKTVANQGGTYQAANSVPIVRFTLTTDVSQAYWTALRVERTGSSSLNPATFPFGHNSDVKYVKLWRDANFNDVLDASDELLTPATIQFNLADENDRVKQVSLTTPMLLSPTPRSFFLSYDIGDGAEAGASVGVKIGDLSWITVSAPNTVSPTLHLLPTGQVTQAYPYSSSLVPINAIQMTIQSQSLSPAQIPQASTGVPVMMFSLQTDRNQVSWKTLRLYQTGTIDTTTNGQGDISTIELWRDNGDSIFQPAVDVLISTVSLTPANTYFASGIANLIINGSSGTVIGSTEAVNFYVTVGVGSLSVNNSSTRGHTFSVEARSFNDFGFIPATAGSNPSNDFVSMYSNDTLILDANAAIVSPVFLLPRIWADPYGDGYPALDNSGTPAPRTYDSAGVAMVDVDGDGENDVINDAATGLPGVDLDGDGLIEMDMTRSKYLSVDFNNDGKPDDVLSDQNGDGVPEIDLSKDGFPDFGYIPEKWSKETSKIFSKWAKVNTMTVQDYEIGLGVNNITNGVTDVMVPQGWFSTSGEPQYELTNLSLLSANVTKLSQSLSRDANPPFDLTVSDGDDFAAENGQINVGSEIMGYSLRIGNVFHINKRGEQYGTPRQEHVLNETVTNQGYVLRARAITSGNVAGAQSAIKVYRVDVSPPTIPVAPISDQELAGGTPAENGIYSIKWSPVTDLESGVRAYEIQEVMDNDPVWKTIRIVPSSQLTFLVGSSDNPSNAPREQGHFFKYRVRAINQAGGTSAWSTESAAAATGFPEEPITEVTNYPNPVDTRQGPTNIAYILNEDASVKIRMFDLLGYQIREWEFSAGTTGGQAGPNIFQWDGTDSSGRKVAAGGYILRIEVIGEKGSTTVIRKIGVIN